MTKFFHLAYIRDGEQYHTKNAMMLAMLLHTTGSRNNQNMTELRKIMRDHNLK